MVFETWYWLCYLNVNLPFFYTLGLAQRHHFCHLFRCITQEPVLRKWVVCFLNIIFVIHYGFWSLRAPKKISNGGFWHLFSPSPTWNTSFLPSFLISLSYELKWSKEKVIPPRISLLFWLEAFLTPDLFCFTSTCYLQRYLCPLSLSYSLESKI